MNIYSDYSITQNCYARATGLSQMLNGQISHDKTTRFLNRAQATSKDLWQYVKREIRKKEETSGVPIFDDSIEEKPYTSESQILAWHYSHAKNTCEKGVNLFVLPSTLQRYSPPPSF